ncbi:unnamed protein product [Cuscuta campestris]|uniref:Uncharacterized protein n=1 Tax=Cuscuta campestris TaxID=132261 RepID=A0A484MVQ3_9ASTE|nr:unnamed protein product [Cuscuta campestris]
MRLEVGEWNGGRTNIEAIIDLFAATNFRYRLVDEAEEIFIKNIAGNYRKKAMKYPKPSLLVNQWKNMTRIHYSTQVHCLWADYNDELGWHVAKVPNSMN